MRSFNFDATKDENQNLEKIITERNRKLVKQQVIFSVILFTLIAILVWYFGRKVVYAEFDGYIQTDYVNYRALDDIFLFEQRFQEGDIVLPGDTLYSYMYLDNVLGQENINSEPTVITSDRNIRLQTGVAYQDANVLRVRIRELQKQIAQEDHNIQFGLTDNSHKMDLQRELAETKEELKAVLNKVGVYNSIGQETKHAVDRSGYIYGIREGHNDGDFFKSFRERFPSAVRYSIVRDTCVVTKIWAPELHPVFKKEQIVQLQTLNLTHSNMRVMAYVPTGDMKKINNHSKAEIIVSDDVSFTASVQLLGARTEDLPEELRNSLSHTTTTVIVVFRPDPDQKLPFWSVVDRVPVKVRIKNFDNGSHGDETDYWYIHNGGLTEETKKVIEQYHRRNIRRVSEPIDEMIVSEEVIPYIEKSQSKGKKDKKE